MSPDLGHSRWQAIQTVLAECLAVIPVMLLRAARRDGEGTPVWQATWQAHPILQFLLIASHSPAIVYSVILILGLVPAGWTEAARSRVG